MVKKRIVAIVTTLVILLSFTPVISHAYGGSQDNNSVVAGGVSSSSNLTQAYKTSGVATIYNYFGISSADINNSSSHWVNGTVTSSGKVIVNGKVVATNAITAGRQNIDGSTKVTRDGTTFYVRPTNVSFRQSSLPAYVLMKNGQFQNAIIAECGNPVMATPVRPVVTHKPIQSQAPQPQASAAATASAQVVVNNTPAQPQATTATAAPTSATAPQSLPKTGPGNALQIRGITTVVSSLGHYFYRRRSTKSLF